MTDPNAITGGVISTPDDGFPSFDSEDSQNVEADLSSESFNEQEADFASEGTDD